MIYGAHFETPLGVLTLLEENHALIAVSFGRQPVAALEQTPLLMQTEKQLKEYFKGQRNVFDLPLQMKGTQFQQEVWQALQEIPYGETRTYSDIAVAIGRPKATRAVGMANHCNPLAIIVPCHRVIGKNGSLTGYAGGLEKKQALLALESSER
ncbi:MAG TPA: methylated-DNA--[protein]-cysteine S-methyltransferase [Firmicutes bacterium]|nr:methylated-DNA--[protein]-cysteine S-methyltransferase [Bacillota bacterium]